MALPGRINQTTIAKYLNGAWNNHAQNKFIFKMLQDKGHMTFGNSGTTLSWRMRVGKYQAAAYEAGVDRTFTSKGHYAQANLPWTEIDLTEEITQLEMKENRNKEALINLNKRVLRDMSMDIKEQMGFFIIQGDGTLSPAQPSGMESFLSDDGTPVPASGTKELNPNSTYAGLSCALGAVAALPDVTAADVLADAWSPIIVDATSSDFTGTTWAVNALDALRYANIRATKGNTKELRIDAFLCNQADYVAILNLLQAQQINYIRSTPASVEGAGFDKIEFDTVTVVWDEDVPAGTVYGVNFDWMYYDFLDPTPVTVEQDDFIVSKSRLFAAQSAGQLRFNPRYFVKIKTV